MNTVVVLVFALGCFQFAAGKRCHEHSHYEHCGTACPLTCDNYQSPPTACPLPCVSGCFCDRGYVYDEAVGCCVRPSNCTQECGPAEVYSNCSSACQPYCENPHPNCTLQCVKACVCIDGYIRDVENGTCIPIENCTSHHCPLYEQFSYCTTNCQPYCEDQHPNCTDVCVEGCECIDGYIREVENGTCIPIENCTVNCQCPGEHEVYVNCTACEPTCLNPNGTENCTEPCTPGCICSTGYVRDENGDCIPEDECPTVTDPPCNSTTTVPPERSHSGRVHHDNKRDHDANQNRHHNNKHHSENQFSGRHQNVRQHSAKHHESKHHENKHHENKHHENKHHSLKHHEAKHHDTKHHEAKHHDMKHHE